MRDSWVSRFLDSIRELYYRSELILEHHTCRESKVLCKSDCSEVEARLRNCKRCSVRYKGLMMLVAERPTVASIVPFSGSPEQGQ